MPDKTESQKFTPIEVAYSTFGRDDRMVWKRKVVRSQKQLDAIIDEAVEVRTRELEES